MAEDFNLLPPDQTLSRDLERVLKTLRALGVIVIVAFLITGIGMTAFFVVLNSRFASVSTKVGTLKSQVAAQEASEQQIVLLKDRLEKIASIQNSPNGLPNLGLVEPLLSNLSPSAAISKIKVNASGTGLGLNIISNTDLTTFLSSVKNPDVFKETDLTSLSLSPELGYSIEVQMVKK